MDLICLILKISVSFVTFENIESNKIGKTQKEGVHLRIWEILAKFFGGKACGAT